jgi:hypothetical protein
MNDQGDASANEEADGWPVPSGQVLRELDPPAVDWSESEPAATPQIRLPARG